MERRPALSGLIRARSQVKRLFTRAFRQVKAAQPSVIASDGVGLPGAMCAAPCAKKVSGTVLAALALREFEPFRGR